MREPGEDDPDEGEEPWAPPGGRVAFVLAQLAAGRTEIEIEHMLAERYGRDRQRQREVAATFDDPAWATPIRPAPPVAARSFHDTEKEET